MKKKLLWMSAAMLMFCGTMSVQAQTQETEKTVKRIVFDRERVTLIYADGTADENVEQTTIKRKTSPTGIKTPKTKTTTTKTVWYTMDGRPLQREPKDKGVYLKKEGDKIRKTVKK